MTRLAAIDCGTNSIRLLVVDAVGPGQQGWLEVDRRMLIVRLGEGVDRTGRLSAAALARTFEACEVFAEVLAQLRPDRLRFVATSATRDAANAAEFAAGVQGRLGVSPQVVTGGEEAALSFAGAVAGLPPGTVDPLLVVDIGGGSTEFVTGPAVGAATVGAATVGPATVGPAPESTAPVPVRGWSKDVGCVRLTERHLHSDPPTAQEVARATAEVGGALDAAAAAVDIAAARTLVGLAGSVTTVAAAVLGLGRHDPASVHHARLPLDRVAASCDRLLAMTRAERAALPFLHPGRVDVIGAGALVLRAVCARVGPHLAVPELLVSEHDILDGIAMSLR